MQFLYGRFDFVGLSTGTKPTRELRDGTTFYTVDTQELYIWYNGNWYNQNPIETTPADETPVDEPPADDTRNEETPNNDDMR